MRILPSYLRNIVAYSAVAIGQILLVPKSSNPDDVAPVASAQSPYDEQICSSFSQNPPAKEPRTKEVIEEMQRIRSSEDLSLGDMPDWVSTFVEYEDKQKETSISEEKSEFAYPRYPWIYFKDEKERVKILTSEIDKVKREIEDAICPLLVKIENQDTFISSHDVITEKINEVIKKQNENIQNMNASLEKLEAKVRDPKTPPNKEDLKEIDTLRIKLRAQRFGLSVLNSFSTRFGGYGHLLSILEERASYNLSLRNDPEKLFDKYLPTMRALKSRADRVDSGEQIYILYGQQMHKAFDKAILSTPDKISRELKAIQRELIVKGIFSDNLQAAKEKLEKIKASQLYILISTINNILELQKDKQCEKEYTECLKFINYLVQNPKFKVTISLGEYDYPRGYSSLTEVKLADKSTRYIVAAHIADFYFKSQDRFSRIIGRDSGLEVVLVRNIINMPKYGTATIGVYSSDKNIIAIDIEYIFPNLRSGVQFNGDYPAIPGIEPNGIIPHELGGHADDASEKSIFGNYCFDGMLPGLTSKQKKEFKDIRAELFKIHNTKSNNSSSSASGSVPSWIGTDSLTGFPNYTFENDNEFLAETISTFYVNPNVFFQDGEDKKAKALKIGLYNLYKVIFNIDPKTIR